MTTSAFVKKEMPKMKHLKKFGKLMEVKLRSKMSHSPKISHRYALVVTFFSCIPVMICGIKIRKKGKCMTDENTYFPMT